MSLITKRVGKKVAVKFGQGILSSPRVRIEEPTPAVREAAWALFSGWPDKEWDLIDCLSFSIMEAHEIREAFAFDHHYEQRGLVLLPGRQ